MLLKKQSGAVLIVSLVMLIALTLFVLSGSQSVIIQEKMTSAVRDMRVSLEAAESGVKLAEARIEDFTSAIAADNTTAGLYAEGAEGDGPTDLFADTTWNSDNFFSESSASGTAVNYFIQDMGEITFADDNSSLAVNNYGTTTATSVAEVFKIVSRSTGLSGNTERIIVSYYAKSF